MAEATKSGVFARELIKVAIVLLIAFSGWFIPAPAPITEIGMRVITVFLSMVVGWTITGNVWVSLAGLILFPLTGVMTFNQYLAAGWGSNALFFMIFAFVLVGFLNVSGVSKYIVNWLMSRKFLNGHPWRLIFMVIFAAYIVCSLLNTFIGMFIMWEIVYGITRNIGGKPFDKFPTLMVFAIAMQGAFGLSAMPWGGNSIANLGVYAGVVGHPANFVSYILFTLPFGLMQIAAFMALSKFVFRLDVTPLKDFQITSLNPEDSVLTPERKHALILLVIFIVMLLSPSFFPAGSSLAVLYNQFGSCGVCVLFFAIACVLYRKDKLVVDFHGLASKNVPWNMIMMVAVILGIGGALNNQATGIPAFLAQTVVPMLTSIPPELFLLVVIAVVVLLTNFLINMVVVAMFLPVVMPICATMGLSPDLVAFAIMLASTNAILTPAGCAAASVLFPNKEWMRTSDIYKYGVPTVIVNTLLIVAWCLICPM